MGYVHYVRYVGYRVPCGQIAGKKACPARLFPSCRELLAYRTAMGLTPVELAELVGVNDKTIRRWEGAQPISVDGARKILALIEQWRDMAEEITEISLTPSRFTVFELFDGGDQGAEFAWEAPTGAIAIPPSHHRLEWMKHYPRGFILTAAAHSGVRLV